MPTVSGAYRTTNVLTIAAMKALIDAYLDVQEARLAVLGGPTALIAGSMNLLFTASNGIGFTHRINHTINCPTLADLKTLTAALVVFATAVETESAFTTIVSVDVSLNTTFSD